MASVEFLTSSFIGEVVEFYRMTGDADYMLKIMCRDIAGYDRIDKSLIRRTAIHDVSSSFAMEQIKGSTRPPIWTGREGL